MRQIATMTSKGQITVPRALRERLRLTAGDRLSFEEADGKVIVTPVRDENPFEKYRGIGNGISGGKEGVLRWVRDIRGDSDERGHKRSCQSVR